MLPHRHYTRDRLRRTEERLAALVRPERAPVDTLEIAGPVDRIAAAEAGALDYAPVALGAELGPLFATYWLRVTATVPSHWAGARVDLVADTRSEATLWVGGRAVQGLNSGREPAAPRRDADRDRAAGERPWRSRSRSPATTPSGSASSARARAAATGRARRSSSTPASSPASTPTPGACASTSPRSARWRLEDGVDAAFAGELLAGLDDFCNAWDAEGPLHLGAGRRDPHRAVRAPRRRRAAPALRGRPRAPRHRLALAARGDAGASACGRSRRSCGSWTSTPSTSSRLAGPALRVDPRARPGALGRHPRARRARAVGAGRRDVDRARLQPALGRVARAPVPLRPALLRARARPPLHGVLAARTSSATPASSRSSCARRASRRFLTQKLSLEPLQPARAPHVHLAGHRRQRGAHPLPARRHLQRRGDRRRAARAASAAYKDHDRTRAQPARLRPRRRRRRADPRDARAPAPRARPARACRARRCAIAEAFFDGLEAERGRPADGRRRAVLRAPPRHVHDQAALKRGNRRGEAALHDAELLRRRCALGRAPYPRDELAEAVARRCCSTSSTTSSRAPRSPRSTRAPGRPRRGRGAAPTRCGRGAGGAPAGGDDVPVNTHRVRRGARSSSDAGRRARASSTRRRAARARRSTAGGRACASSARRRRVVLDNAHLRATLARRRRRSRSLVHRASGREALAAPANRLELYEDRPVAWDAWDVDPFHLETREDCPPADGVAAIARAAAARRGRVRARRSVSAGGCARRSGSTRGRGGSRSTATSTGTRPPLAEGRLPARRARRRGDLRDRVRRRAAPDALLHPPPTSPASRSPATAGPTSPSTASASPLLTDSKYGYSAFGDTLRITPAARAARPDPEADRGRAPLRLRARSRTPAAGRTRASSRRRRRSTRRCAGPARQPRRRLGARRGRRRPRARHGQARRGLRTRSCCASTRPTAAAAARGSGSACRSRPRGGRTCSRTTSGPPRSTATRVVVDFRPLADRHAARRLSRRPRLTAPGRRPAGSASRSCATGRRGSRRATRAASS